MNNKLRSTIDITYDHEIKIKITKKNKKKRHYKYFILHFSKMGKYQVLLIYQLIFTYSALSLYIPVCDCHQAKTRGILDINKPYYCQKGKTDTPYHSRINTSYTLITKQRPIVTWKGWFCKQWIK